MGRVARSRKKKEKLGKRKCYREKYKHQRDREKQGYKEAEMRGKEGERLGGIKTKLNVNFLIPFYSVFRSPSSVCYRYLLVSLEIVTKPVTVLLCFFMFDFYLLNFRSSTLLSDPYESCLGGEG